MRLGGGELDAEQVGDLGYGQVVAVAEHERGALLRGQRLEVAEQGRDVAPFGERVIGTARRGAVQGNLVRRRWERATTFLLARLAETFVGQEGFADIALAQARRAERMLAETDPALVQMPVYETLGKVLVKTGKADEAKKYTALYAKLETRDAAEYEKAMLKFETPAFAGRKAKSDRVALVEVFTGAECPPCVAVDVAFDGLLKTYKPTDAIFLQYHFHVPGPDPLASPDGMERVDLYGEAIRSAPTAFLNGKPVAKGGGGAAAAKAKYAEFRTAIDDALEKPPAAKIALAVTKDDKGFSVKATASDLEKPGEKVMLRFALIEDRVRYTGGNGVRYHQQVVRAMPGGAKGIALTKKSQEQSVTVNAEEVKGKQVKYSDDYAKAEGPFPRLVPTPALQGLKVVAFIQDDVTGEVLNAAQIELK